MAPRTSPRSCSTPSWVEPRPITRRNARALGPKAKAPNTGLPLQPPWVAIMNRRTEIARKLAAGPALSPTHRCRVGLALREAAPPPDDEQPF